MRSKMALAVTSALAGAGTTGAVAGALTTDGSTLLGLCGGAIVALAGLLASSCASYQITQDIRYPAHGAFRAPLNIAMASFVAMGISFSLSVLVAGSEGCGSAASGRAPGDCNPPADLKLGMFVVAVMAGGCIAGWFIASRDLIISSILDKEKEPVEFSLARRAMWRATWLCLPPAYFGLIGTAVALQHAEGGVAWIVGTLLSVMAVIFGAVGVRRYRRESISWR